jgi:hypothetical protein
VFLPDNQRREYFVAVRVRPDGSLDSTFGEGGRVLARFWLDSGDERAYAGTLDSSRAVIVAGLAYVPNSPDYNVLVRFR